MKAKVLVEFYDLKADELRSVGDTFELSPERFDEIIKRGGEWLEEAATVEEMEIVEKTNNKAKKNTTKKAGAKSDGGRTKKA